MVHIEKILDEAIEKNASDVHLICGLKPMIRVSKKLEVINGMEELDEEDMTEIYDFFIRGNIHKDNMFNRTRRLDMSFDYEKIRLRVNITSVDYVPTFTLRLIKDELPKYEDLGIPEVVKKMTNQQQGLILVTGKINSGKSTTLNALINEINETSNKKIITLENPVEYKHKSKKSVILQKEVGPGKDCVTFSDGVKNSLREDCDIVVIGEIRDRETMDAAIETAETGHLVIGTLHTKSCAETVDRIINFYDIKDQVSVKFLLSSLLKLVVSQRLVRGVDEKLVLIPEVMVVDKVISGLIRKEKLGISELEDAMQSSLDKGNISIINSLAKLFVEDKITLDQAKEQIEDRNLDVLNRTIMQLKIKHGKH